ncbi:MAG: hypothetical protein JWO86_78, partial [Myxococcaceae bacterium]|nr:hypothetical protein [Myxococcaceae bacterium]
ARRILTSLVFLAPAALPALLAACPGSSGDGPGTQHATLVVGVQTEDFGGLVEAVHIVATVDGKVASDETVTTAALPKELVLTGTSGATAEVMVEALTSQAATRGTPTTSVVVRRAAAHLVPDVKKLLRVRLETRCVTFTAPGNPLPPAPTCDAPQTCALGRCVSEDVPFDQLEDYEATWATSPPDICRPANHGPPEVVLGTGQTDFAPLTDGQTLMLERGPQGGHHIWIAVRMRNLRQSGSPTTLTAKLVDDPTSPIAPAAYVFTFDRDEGNYCKLFGLRFQLDSGASDLGADYKRFLGKKLEVTASVTDSTKTTASSSKVIQLADKLLCPDGTTTTCN